MFIFLNLQEYVSPILGQQRNEVKLSAFGDNVSIFSSLDDPFFVEDEDSKRTAHIRLDQLTVSHSGR